MKFLDLCSSALVDIVLRVKDLPINIRTKTAMCLAYFPRDLYYTIRDEVRYNRWIREDSQKSLQVFAEMRARSKKYTEIDVIRSNLANLKNGGKGL